MNPKMAYHTALAKLEGATNQYQVTDAANKAKTECVLSFIKSRLIAGMNTQLIVAHQANEADWQ